jgi:glycosyltransferase involved in cell wall biosynthesis
VSAFDVVIPAFNPPPALLRGAVASALAAGAERVVVIDDGSAPEVALDPRSGLTLLRQPNAGPSAARNHGLAHTTSDWIVFLDADDELDAAGVAKLLELASSLNAVAAVAARWELDESGTRTLREVPTEWSGRELPRKGDVFRPIALFSTTGMVIRRDVLDAGVRFDTSIIYGEDRDFLRRAADLGPVAVGPAPAVVQRVFRDGTNLRSRRGLPRWIADHLVLLARHCDAESEHHFRDQTRWLINAASKARVGKESWDPLVREAARRGWGVPLKCRMRRWF